MPEIPSGFWVTNVGESDLRRAMEQLDKDSDRAAAVVGAAILDTRLTGSIKARLHSADDIDERMFRSSGPLGSLSAKIDLAFMLGIVGRQAHRDLHTIRDIRNRFAHHLDIIDFRSQSVSDLCANLKLVDEHIIDPPNNLSDLVTTRATTRFRMFFPGATEALRGPRTRYLLSVMVLSTVLYGMPAPPPVKPPPPPM
jgi:hypothetical protein